MRRLDLRGRALEVEDLLHAMIQIRAVETSLATAYLEGGFEGPLHVSIGQEGVAVGVAAATLPTDLMFSTHRGHGHALAMGLDPGQLVAEIVGSPSGYAAGQGGSMHIIDVPSGFLGTNGIVGDSAGIAVGSAWELKIAGRDDVVICMLGDGAMGTGIVYETMNMAALWRVPIVFVCENNQYAEMSPTSVHLSTSPHERSRAFGLESYLVDGNDVRAVHEVTSDCIARARSGVPQFIECSTHRWYGHYVGDTQHYRPEGESERWTALCPIHRLASAAGFPPNHLEDLYQEAMSLVRSHLTSVSD